MDFQFGNQVDNSLRNYLKSKITIKDFFQVVQELIQQITKVKELGLQVVLDIDSIRYTNGTVEMETIREDSVFQFEAIKSFLKQMTFKTVFGEAENCKDVTDFLKFMDDANSCQRIEDIYEYCEDQNYDPSKEDSFINPFIQNEKPFSQKEKTFVQDENLFSQNNNSQLNSFLPKEEPKKPTIWDVADGSYVPPESGETGVLDPRFWDSIDTSKEDLDGSYVPPESGETGILDPRYWDDLKRKNKFENSRGVQSNYQENQISGRGNQAGFQNEQVMDQGMQPGFQKGQIPGRGMQPGFQNAQMMGQGMQPEYQNGQIPGRGMQPEYQNGQMMGQGMQAGFQSGQIPGRGMQPGFQNSQMMGQGMQAGFQNGQMMSQGMQAGFQNGQIPGRNTQPDYQNGQIPGRGMQAGYLGDQSFGDRNFGQGMQYNENSVGGETGILDQSFWDRLENNKESQFKSQQRMESIVASLVQLKNGFITYINNDNFTIGKDHVDMVIDHPTVSRKHAVIVRKGNHFFISDSGSTNKTYVEDQEIPEKASVEIFNGTKIKFANEEYKFVME